MLRNFIIVGCIVFSTLCYGKDITIPLQEGAITLGEFVNACEDAATSKSAKRVQTHIPGKIISIKGVSYEIRFFSFEDTSGKVSPDTSFRDYAKQNNLLTLKSSSTTPLPGIHFESFDFRTTPLKDGVYFSMALRKLEDEGN
jgi:hypothetical protein